MAIEAQPYANFGSAEVTERSNEVIDLPAASVGMIAEGRPRVNDGASQRGRKGKSSAKLA